MDASATGQPSQAKGGNPSSGHTNVEDKLLQEVIRMILEAYYEPQFSDRSHGFRPGRGCYWSNVVDTGPVSRQGDIKGCFDDHEVLSARLHDNRFLRLLKYLLKAGYVEDWKYGRTLSGTARGCGQPHPLQHLPRPVGRPC